MSLTRLVLTNFRNIEASDIEVSSGFNFIIGANGSGKTSFLEAIYFLAHGRSFKTNLVSRIINNSSDQLSIFGQIDTTNGSIPIGLSRHKNGTSELKIAGQSGQKLASLAQIIPLQIIHPEGFELLTEGPKNRRSFIDWGVFHSQPPFFSVWSRFKRLSKQRNALLKTANNYQELQHWDQELANLAKQIDQWRNDYVQQLIPTIMDICALFLPDFEVTIQYYRGWDKNTDYAQLLQDNFQRDQQIGYTVSGPNKADLRIKISGVPVDDVLSRGQLKLLMCALHVAQGQNFTHLTQKPCIYLIDDFASELDYVHRTRLSECLEATKAQVFISSITEQNISAMKSNKSKIFHVKNGKIDALKKARE